MVKMSRIEVSKETKKMLEDLADPDETLEDVILSLGTPEPDEEEEDDEDEDDEDE